MGTVRVRFAPSPTGYFHVGSARAALYNWLFARQQGGVFVLRIEDTDVERNRPEHIEGIQRALRWLGLDWDEGPYFQSERGERYQAAIDKLVTDGAAYGCDCTPDVVAARAKARGATPSYDGHCRERGLEVGPGVAVRFRTPDEGVTMVEDLVRGHVEFANSTLEDFAIRKSSGQPLFILANVVDDADMAISHVVRGEDHLTNTAKYELLWSALAYGDYPTFAHLPLLVNERRQKLSKRRDKVALEQYRDEGYLAEAMVNYMALLGWSPGDDREMLTRDQLIGLFRLEDVRGSPAYFDEKKLSAVNSEYIRALPTSDFVERAESWLDDRWQPLAGLVQERARTLADSFAMIAFLFLPEPPLDLGAWEKAVRQQPAFETLLAGAVEAYAECPWDAASIKAATMSVGEKTGVPQLGKAQAPIRLAVTGRAVGLPLFESLVTLGRERTLARLNHALARLEEATPGG
ncbi:MAG: glutamate--tRNA ligase [Acidimicrobiales bacterium]